MSEVVDIIPQPGGRVLVYDDGSRVTELDPIHIEGDPGPGPEDRGLGERFLLGQDPGALGRRAVRADSVEDIAWLRFEIEHGNIIRESGSTRVATRDEFVIIGEHEGWVYTIGRRTALTVAHRVTGRVGDSPLMSPEAYIWGVRGGEMARAAWARDYVRTGSPPILSRETMGALADRGIPPESALTDRSTHEFSWSDIPASIMLISQAALHAQESVRRYTDRFVAQYNDHPLGSVIAVIVGIIEFAFRLVTDVIGLPAAMAELYRTLGETLDALRASGPDLAEGMREAPLETSAAVAEATYDAIRAVTGLGDIGAELSTAVDTAGDGRTAESSLHIIRATGRVLDLIMIVHGLVSVLRRIPAVVARMRTAVAGLTESARALRAARAALREGRAIAHGAEDAATGARARTPTPEAPDAPPAREGSGTPDGERAPETAAPEGEAPASDGAAPTEEHPGLDESFAEHPGTDGSAPLPSHGSTTATRALTAEREALNFLRTQVLTAEQMEAAGRIVGRNLGDTLRRVWESVINDLDRRDMAEIRRLLQRAEDPSSSVAVSEALRRGAYEIARNYLYPRVAGRFWNRILDTPDLLADFRAAGLEIRRNRVPAWILEDGREVRLSLEHQTRVSDNPLECINPRNLMIVPLAENSYMLEAIRAVQRYAELLGTGGG